MFIIRHRRFFFVFSVLMIFASLFAVLNFGLRLGTDFTGGTIVELEYADVRPDKEELLARVKTVPGLVSVNVQPIGEKGVLVRMGAITEEQHGLILQAAGFDGARPFVEKRYSSIGPVIGSELARKGLIAIVLVMALIVAYVALAFRGVNRPVSSWKYGFIAVLALLHDITIPLGVFAVLGHYQGVEIDALFLTALLTIMGLSVNDTIVIFDRIRENLKHKISNSFRETVGISLNQTFARSLISSLTIIAVLAVLYVFGGETTEHFALALTIGMVVGTYSSLFVAAPLLVAWERSQRVS